LTIDTRNVRQLFRSRIEVMEQSGQAGTLRWAVIS